MWVFLNSAFVSIVTDTKNPHNLLVRARRKGDIERTFSTARVSCTPNADYRYRASINRKVVAAAIANAIIGIPYPNFKDSIPAEDDDRHDFYSRVWGLGWDWQNRNEPPPEPPARGLPDDPGETRSGRSLGRGR
jgi:hypothetical protein